VRVRADADFDRTGPYTDEEDAMQMFTVSDVNENNEVDEGEVNGVIIALTGSGIDSSQLAWIETICGPLPWNFTEFNCVYTFASAYIPNVQTLAEAEEQFRFVAVSGAHFIVSDYPYKGGVGFLFFILIYYFIQLLLGILSI